MTSHRRIAAAVIRPHITWFGLLDETPMHVQTPEWMHGLQFGRLLDTAGPWFRLVGEGTVLVQLPALDALTPAGRRKLAADLVSDLDAHGWRTTMAGAETGWFTCLKDQCPPISLGIGAWINQGRTPLLELDQTAPAIAVCDQLTQYQKHTGGRWAGTGGLSGVARLRNLREQMANRYGTPLWKWASPDHEVIGKAFELQGSRHQRPPVPGVDGDYVHHYDVRAMYLAAAAGAELGWSTPERRGPQEFDPARPGYWKVAARDLQLLNDPLELLTRVDRADENGMVWLTTPVMQFLDQAGVRPEIHDSLTSDRSGRIMRAWAEQLRDALAHPGTTPIRGAIKDTYARTVGMFNRPTSRIYRPDWRDTIVDLAKINLLRKCAMVSPLRYNIDSIWVATDYADGRNSPFIDNNNMGALRYEKTMLMTEYLDTYGAKK